MNIKDKKITIMYSIDDGESMIPMPGGENIWAYYRQASGREVFEAASYQTKVDVIFEINWRNNLDNYCQIVYNNKNYDITRIDDFEGYKTGLKVYASLIR